MAVISQIMHIENHLRITHELAHAVGLGHMAS